MLPEIIPLFPLPNVVFFPGMPLPLHVFEPRYRAMVRQALGGARLIGMVLLRGGWQRDYEGRPPVFSTGTVGEIVHVEELEDGRFNVVLRGLREFQILDEMPPRATFREARVRWREASPDDLGRDTREAIVGLVQRYLARLGRELAAGAAVARGVDGGSLINFFAQELDLDPLEKQALLDEPTIDRRGRRLLDVLEFRVRELGGPGTGTHGRAH